MPDGVAARRVLSHFRFRSRAVKRVAAVSLDLPIRGHSEPGARLASFRNLVSGEAIVIGSGWLLSQSTRAAAVGSIPALFHQARSSPHRWISRWWPAAPRFAFLYFRGNSGAVPY